MDKAILENVRNQAILLAEASPVISKMVQRKELIVAGGIGRVQELSGNGSCLSLTALPYFQPLRGLAASLSGFPGYPPTMDRSLNT